MVPPNKASVLVANAEPVTMHGLLELMSLDGHLRICAQTGCSRNARVLCEKHQPDVLVLDPAMNAGDGFVLLKELSRWSPHTRAVVFTPLEDPLSVQRAFRAGAAAYVTRRDPAAAVLSAIEGALNGERQIGPRVQQILLERLASGALELRDTEEARLSERELQIYRLLGGARSTREIAAELRLGVKTVETHQQRIREKLRVPNGAELRRRATLYSAPRADAVF